MKRHFFSSRVLLAGAIIMTGLAAVAVNPVGAQNGLPAFQMACPHLAGLTVQWQGTWAASDLPYSGSYSGPMTINDDGTVNGSFTSLMNGGGSEGGTWTGSVSMDCETITIAATTPVTTSISLSGGNDLVVGSSGNTNCPNPNELCLGTDPSDPAEWTYVLRGSTTAHDSQSSATALSVPNIAVSAPSFGTYDVSVTGTGPSPTPPPPKSAVTLTDPYGKSCTTGTLTPVGTTSTGQGTCTITGEPPSHSGPADGSLMVGSNNAISALFSHGYTFVGLAITDSDGAIPAGTTITALSDGSATLSQPATGDERDDTFTVNGLATVAAFPGDPGTYDAPDPSPISYFAGSNGSAAVVTDPSDGVTVDADGGSSTDGVAEIGYPIDPTGDLEDGTSFFDVAVTQPSGFTYVTVTDCNNVTTSTVLEYWNGSSWSDVVGDTNVMAPEPSYPTINGIQCVSYALDNTLPTSPSLTELTGTVFGAVATQDITSVDSATGRTGKRFSLTVTTVGSPTPTITETGGLPSGMHLVDNGNGTAILSGTPNKNSGGVYEPTIEATFGTGASAVTVDQLFTLFVFRTPTIKTRSIPAATVNSQYSATIGTKGFPPPLMSESGALPGGVTFTDDGDGSATVAGTPASGTEGTYRFVVTASNGEGRKATRRFTLVVNS
jgi:large repetitive protein